VLPLRIIMALSIREKTAQNLTCGKVISAENSGYIE